MKSVDRQAFAISLQYLAVVFKTELTTPFLEAYWMALEDLPLEAVQCACARALRHETFFPVPAILRDYARDALRTQRVLEEETNQAQQLRLREGLMGKEAVQALINQVWPSAQLKAQAEQVQRGRDEASDDDSWPIEHKG